MNIESAIIFLIAIVIVDHTQYRPGQQLTALAACRDKEDRSSGVILAMARVYPASRN